MWIFSLRLESQGPPEGTEKGGDGEPISPGDSDPYPAGG